MSKYDCLKLENQLCFPLYAASKEIVRKYKPILDRLDLTYTQYITMMVMWEYSELNVKEIGDKLFLDSGTLTPVLKTLEHKGYIIRNREEHDERNVIIHIHDAGKKRKVQALKVPEEISKCIKLSEEEATTLYNVLYKILDCVKE